MAESFSPFLQSHSTMVWLSSRPTEARRLPSAVEGRPKPLSTAQAEPALVQRSLALVSNMKAVWWVWSTAGDSLTPTYRSQQCLCLGPIKGSERNSSTLMLSDCRVWETAEIGLLVLLVNWASCELAPFLMSKRSFFCSPVWKNLRIQKVGCVESLWIGELNAVGESRTAIYQKSPERTLRAGGNPSTQTWALMFLCPKCGWRNLCRPAYTRTFKVCTQCT